MARNRHMEHRILQYTYNHQGVNQSLQSAQKSAGDLSSLLSKKAARPSKGKKEDGKEHKK